MNQFSRQFPSDRGRPDGRPEDAQGGSPAFPNSASRRTNSSGPSEKSEFSPGAIHLLASKHRATFVGPGSHHAEVEQFHGERVSVVFARSGIVKVRSAVFEGIVDGYYQFQGMTPDVPDSSELYFRKIHRYPEFERYNSQVRREPDFLLDRENQSQIFHKLSSMKEPALMYFGAPRGLPVCGEVVGAHLSRSREIVVWFKDGRLFSPRNGNEIYFIEPLKTADELIRELAAASAAGEMPRQEMERPLSPRHRRVEVSQTHNPIALSLQRAYSEGTVTSYAPHSIPDPKRYAYVNIGTGELLNPALPLATDGTVLQVELAPGIALGTTKAVSNTYPFQSFRSTTHGMILSIESDSGTLLGEYRGYYRTAEGSVVYCFDSFLVPHESLEGSVYTYHWHSDGVAIIGARSESVSTTEQSRDNDQRNDFYPPLPP
ncbi:MAG: hypothetical protein KDD60_05835, partial [Bdellovibrionales bacterium]|nr:hypothetical protein [Bdellovibrionales bacterium]